MALTAFGQVQGDLGVPPRKGTPNETNDDLSQKVLIKIPQQSYRLNIKLTEVDELNR